MVNLRLDGTLRWKAKDHQLEKVRKCDVESWHIQRCHPRLCQLRTDGLTLTSKY
jgi:hypothetical protein